MGDYILYSSSSRASLMSGAPRMTKDAEYCLDSSELLGRCCWKSVAVRKKLVSQNHDGTPASVGQLDYIQSGVELMQESGMARV